MKPTPFHEGLWAWVGGRSPGSRAYPFAPSQSAGGGSVASRRMARAAMGIPGHSGGSAPDSHRLPLTTDLEHADPTSRRACQSGRSTASLRRARRSSQADSASRIQALALASARKRAGDSGTSLPLMAARSMRPASPSAERCFATAWRVIGSDAGQSGHARDPVAAAARRASGAAWDRPGAANTRPISSLKRPPAPSSRQSDASGNDGMLSRHDHAAAGRPPATTRISTASRRLIRAFPTTRRADAAHQPTSIRISRSGSASQRSRPSSLASASQTSSGLASIPTSLETGIATLLDNQMVAIVLTTAQLSKG